MSENASITPDCADHDAHVRRFNLYRASLAATLLSEHARLCPCCILHGARGCDFGKVLVPIIEEPNL